VKTFSYSVLGLLAILGLAQASYLKVGGMSQDASQIGFMERQKWREVGKLDGSSKL